jgi:hypothetical protein
LWFFGELIDNCETLHVGIIPLGFGVGKSVHYHTIQINQPTRCNCFTSLLLESLCVAQHVSGASTPIIFGGGLAGYNQLDYHQQRSYHQRSNGET